MKNFTEPKAHLVRYSLIINIFPNHAQTVNKELRWALYDMTAAGQFWFPFVLTQTFKIIHHRFPFKCLSCGKNTV